jgi:hypothetical protein
MDELNIIEHVYREQTSIIRALTYAQSHHFSFIKGFTDHHGDHNVNLEALVALADSIYPTFARQWTARELERSIQ